MNASTKSQVWWSWPGGIGWPTPIPLAGGGNNMAGNVLPPGFKVNEQGVVAPPITVFNGGKRSGTKRGHKATRKNRKHRKATRKNKKTNRKSRRNNRK